MKIIEVGAFEAKTQFSRLLRDVEAGAIVRIQRRGQRVAEMTQLHDRDLDNRRATEALGRIATIRGNFTTSEIIELREAGRER